VSLLLLGACSLSRKTGPAETVPADQKKSSSSLDKALQRTVDDRSWEGLRVDELPDSSRTSSNMQITFRNLNGVMHLELDPLDELIEVEFRGSQLHAPPSNPQAREMQHSPQGSPAQISVKNEQNYAASRDTSGQGSPGEGGPKPGLQPVIPPQSAVLDSLTADRLLAKIRQAQKSFYNREYDRAALLTREALQIRETAEGYALLGSVEYMRQNTPQAIYNWKRALDLNPDMESVREWLRKTGGE